MELSARTIIVLNFNISIQFDSMRLERCAAQMVIKWLCAFIAVPLIPAFYAHNKIGPATDLINVK